VLLLIGPVGANVFSDGFVNMFTDPILGEIVSHCGFNQSTGPQPFLHALIDGQIFPYVNSCYVLKPNGMPDCDLIEGECSPSSLSCRYVYLIESLLVFGLVWIVILSVGSCFYCVFGSRVCKGMEDYSYELSSNSNAETSETERKWMSNTILLLSSFIAFISLFGLIFVYGGFSDLFSFLQGVQMATNLPQTFSSRAEMSISQCAMEKTIFLLNKNELLDDGSGHVGEHRRLKQLVNLTMEAGRELQKMIIELQILVEGCKKGAQECLPNTTNLYEANFCAYTTQTPQGEHEEGIPSLLLNGNENPACREFLNGSLITCPCCRVCKDLLSALDNLMDSMPDQEDLNFLNITYPPEKVADAATSYFDQYRSTIESVHESLLPVNLSVENATATLRSYDAQVLILDMLFWFPAVIATFFIIVVEKCRKSNQSATLEWTTIQGEMISELEREEEDNKSPHRLLQRVLAGSERKLLWIAFGMGLASTVLLTAPSFAMLSIATLPLNDFCAIIPTTGGSASALLALLDMGGNLQEQMRSLVFTPWKSNLRQDDQRSTARVFVEDCLTSPDGKVWSVWGTSTAQFESSMNLRNSSDILTPLDLYRLLGTDRYRISAYLHRLISQLNIRNFSFGAGPCPSGSFASCSADMATYTRELMSMYKSLTDASSRLLLVSTQLINVSEVTRSNISSLMSIADESTTRMRRALLEAGSCDIVNARYEGVRRPLCEGVVNDVKATWGSFLLSTILWAFLLLSLCIKTSNPR